ncbi:MAG: PAS domain-containing sensor histidine kinase [Candidatus Lokiarchaeota archaeon]|nr:PAS domain-containing sensor histidine kinase [Candidatus Lokiarchaeota archaeon]
MNDKKLKYLVDENSYRECFEKNPTPIYVWKKKKDDLILVDYNESADRLVNNQMNMYLGKKASVMYKDNQNILDDLKQCLNGILIPRKKINYKYKSVNYSRILTVSYILIPPDLVFIYTNFLSREEEWRSPEDNLMESEEKYRSLFEKSPYIVALIEKDGKILEVNSRCEEITGYSKNMLIGKNYLNFESYDKSLRPNLRLRLESMMKGEEVDPLEVLFKKKNGDEIWLLSHINKITIYDEDYILGVVLDVTEKKSAEIKLRDSELKYREAHNRAEFYKDLFAHDINNILQNIRSANELRQIFRKNVNKEQKLNEVTDIINSQVIRGANLVSNIRKSSLLEEFSKKIKPIQFNLLLESAITFVEKMFQERDIRIRVHPFNANLKVDANEFILDVFENILINAVKYNKSPIIRIDIDIKKIDIEEMSFIQFHFIDNGIGIRDQRKKIIFQRGQDKLKIDGGMGLGLSLVKKIIESYNGKIWIKDRIEGDYSQGSNFIIHIPEAINNN